MKTHYIVGVAMLVGFGIGAITVQGLHAQTKPKAYIVTENQLIDAKALATYGPQVQAAIKASGGRLDFLPPGGKIVGLVGTPPTRFGIAEWESLEKAQAWHDSAERKALTPMRDKVFKTVRQFIVEGPAN